MSTFLTEKDLVESTRILELNSLSSLIAFTVKKYSITSRSSSINLFLHNSKTLQTKQLTRYTRGGVGNPFLFVDYHGVEDSVLFLKDGQVWLLPLNGGKIKSSLLILSLLLFL